LQAGGNAVVMVHSRGRQAFQANSQV